MNSVQNLHNALLAGTARVCTSRLIVPVILGLALSLRTMALLDLRRSIYYDFLLWDERVYHTLATQIATGTYAPSTVYEFAPFPAYVMAVIYALLSPDVFYFRVVNLIAGVLTCFVGYRLGKEMAGNGVGIGTCLLMAVYEPFIFYSIVPLTTALSILVFALIAYGALVVIRNPAPLPIFLLGVSCGLAPSIRGNFVVLVPLTLGLIVWLQWREKLSLVQMGRSLAMYLLGFAVIVGPLVIRNYRVAHTFVWLPSQAGFNLYLGNDLANPEPYYRPVPFASTSPFEQGVQFTIEASRRTGRTLSPEEASAYWTQEVFTLMREHPIAFAQRILQKTLALCNSFEPGDHYHVRFISRFVSFFQVPLPRFSLIFPLAIAGMVMTVQGARQLVYATLLGLVYASTLVIFATNTRYRLPLLAVYIPFAVMGMRYFYGCLQRGELRSVAKYCAVLGASILLEILPIPGAGDFTAYYNTHALILDSKGLEAEAISYWEESAQMNGSFSAFANLSLAGKFGRREDYAKAFSYLDRVPDQSFAAAAKHELRGDLLLKLRQPDKAIEAYRQSLAINSGQQGLWLKLVRVLERVDPQRGAQEAEVLKYVSSFYKGF